MKANFQRRIQRYGWDKAAHYYENSWHTQLQPAHDNLIELADIKEGEKVLDIAAGTGLVTFRVAEKVGENGHVLGTDISEEMVKLSIAAAEQQSIKNIGFERMDAESLTCDDNIYDLTFCSLGLMYVPNADIAVKQMYRVLKSGGRAAVAVWGARNQCGWADLFPIVDAQVKSEVCPLFFMLGNESVLQKTFIDAGFEKIIIRKIASTMKYATDEDACEAAFLGGPVAMAYSRFNDEVKNKVHQAYLASIKAYKHKNGYEIPGEFILAQGYKP